jgi:enamine deaminase RidA (YjgF/YER057c/UK114 family)
MQRLLDATPSIPGLQDLVACAAVRVGERVFLSAAGALSSDGSAIGRGDAGAQTHAAMDQLEAALRAAGGSLANITKLTTCVVDRGFRTACYQVIQERLGGIHPVSTGLVVAGLPLPEMIVQIDAEAAIPSRPVRLIRPYTFDSWHGQGFPWRGSMIVASDDELFVRGQTGGNLDHKPMVGTGRGAADAAAQAERAMENLITLLHEAGTSVEDVCKITVFISDRAYRPAVYPMIGRYLSRARPVSTGIITTAFARPEILFEMDTVVLRKVNGQTHRRIRPYNSNIARYGLQEQQLECEFCMAVRAGQRVILRGQTGVGLDHVMHGAGDAKAQAEQAMRNVEQLLAEAGCGLDDVVKATVYVTDREYLADVGRAVLGPLVAAPVAFSSLIVKGLASPELLMEVDIQAISKDAQR